MEVQVGLISNILMSRKKRDGELNIVKNETVNFEIITQVEKQKPMRMTFLQEFFSQ